MCEAVMFFTEYVVFTLQTEQHSFYISNAETDRASLDTMSAALFMSASSPMQTCFGGYGVLSLEKLYFYYGR
jgi:hypothetical protein